MPVPQTRNGSGTSPIVAGDLVLLNREVPQDSHLLAVNKLSGEVVWKHPHLFAPGILNEGYATPVIWKDQVILHTHDGVRGISLSDGQLIWQVNAATAGVSTPVIEGNKLLVATFQTLGEPALRVELPTFEQLKEHDADDNGMISFQEFPDKYKLFDRPEVTDEQGVSMRIKWMLGMVDADKDREITDAEWEGFGQRFAGYVKDHGLLSIELGGEGNVTETHVRILENKNLPEVPSPLVHQGRIYMIKNGGIITCFDSTSGERLYRKRISASGSYYASPIAVGDHIYLTSRQGVVTVLRGSDTLDVLAENDLSEKIMATPAVTDDSLYFRAGRHLYAFSLQDQ
jgi:outer membrane protein assembly factor BamB